MSKNMLIDSAHMEEIRVAVVDGERLDRFDFETPSRAQIKGNIYLAKVVRVEPSLQAAFVDYGCERHGFLSFSEIHHSYFQIPIGDRQNLEEHLQNVIAGRAAEKGEPEEELDPREISRLRYQFYRRYKIQEVIKKRQIMLVQVVKEERGNKGAALTTCISLAGRYCVLMPNTAKGSGVSRKVVDPKEREKLKKIVSEFHVENGSTVVRTAGVGRTRLEIKKDFDYLMKLWDEIRENTLKSEAPALIHEEASIIKRALRDLYSPSIDSIFVEGEAGYKTARNFVKKLMPSQIKKVKLYDDQRVPLFSKFGIDEQINQIYSTRVNLPSGGYLVINTTEALVSVDVNSGRSIRERNVAGTALKTNLEASVEIARQCRLRDLAGLIVVDFIDMEEKRDNSQVERSLREALRHDKARVQVGAISSFGLLELSRQRLRSSIADANMITCPHCSGTGSMWSEESVAIQVLRRIGETCAALDCYEVKVTLSPDVALYLMNRKRSSISEMENRQSVRITFSIDSSIANADFRIEQLTRTATNYDDDDSEIKSSDIFSHEKSTEEQKKEATEAPAELVVQSSPEETTKDAAAPALQRTKSNNRRRKSRTAKAAGEGEVAPQEPEVAPQEPEESFSLASADVHDEEKPKIRGRGRRKRKENISKEGKKPDFKSRILAKIDARAADLPAESSNSTVFKVQTAKSREFGPRRGDVGTDAVSVREQPTEEKKKGWWQKFLKTPGDEAH
ncbi:MAG: Rne/Rng family ribonuclease [Holosporaceae bacterium]|jgi:ribonuclease E|nr:Rne/Rng family ribonuclease [Holosporaceae bacterium]